MDVSEYDQYIPEKELNMNFRIPRKSTAEESNAPYYDGGNTAESSQYDTTTSSLSDYIGLSGAATKASAHSNYRGPVSYNVDTSVKPPMLPTNLKMSTASSQFSDTAAYSNTGSGSLTNKQWHQDNSSSQNSYNTNVGSTWAPSSNSSSFSTGNRSQSAGSQQGNWGKSQDSQWSNAQPKKWNDVQSTKWNSSQSSNWNSGQQSEVNKVQEVQSSSAYSFEWLQSDGNNTQTKWNNDRAQTQSTDQVSKWDNQHSMWNRRGNSAYDGSHALNWNDKGQDNWQNRSAQQWKNTQGDQGASNVNSQFSKSWENTDRPSEKQSSWNWSRGGGGGKNFNRNSYGRGGMQKWGSRNDYNNQQDFRRGTGVLDNDNSEDSLFGVTQDSNPRGYQNNGGQKNFGRYWNKSEKPKKPKVLTPPVVIADTSDETLPKDLRLMFQPLFCKLCSIQMTSNVMAKMHYVSKNHEKKIRKYLIEHSEKTGEPLHPRASLTATQDKKEKEEDKDPKNFYCELCDLQLTGKQHADSHYMGKSHNAVRMGRKRPAGQGFFDASGKWVRKNKEPKLEYGEGEDTFGMDFKKKTEEPETSNTSTPQVAKPQPAAKPSEQFVCSLCVVTCVSQDQLNIHFSGSKHKKKLKAKGIAPENFILTEENAEQMDSEDATTTVSAEPKAMDTDAFQKSKYITPNGFYYCEKCNITVNSEIQFKQHLASKNHAKKANITKTQ